jgi:hypothetical protein
MPHAYQVAALAQLVRALDCGSRGPRFKPGRWYHPFFSRSMKSSQIISVRMIEARLCWGWPRDFRCWSPIAWETAGCVSAARRGSCDWFKVAKCALCSAHTNRLVVLPASVSLSFHELPPKGTMEATWPANRERVRSNPPGQFRRPGSVGTFPTRRRPVAPAIQVHRHEPDPSDGGQGGI